MSAIALEGFTAEQVEAAKQDFIKRAESWDTPGEFAAMYPEAARNDARELLRKAAKAANIPESEKVARMTTLIDNLRWKGGESTAWGHVQKMFPGKPNKQARFYALTLALYGRKRNSQEVEQLIEDWDLPEFILDVYPAIKANRAELDRLINDRIIEQEDAKENEGNFPQWQVDQAIEELELEIVLLEVVEDILDGKDEEALNSLYKSFGVALGNTAKDVSEMFGELVHLFRLS